jgi:WD40 repeat protein
LAKSSNVTMAESNFNKIFVNKKLSNSLLNNMPTICLKWYPYGNFSLNILYFANVNGYIGVLDRESQERRIIIEEEDEISCIDFNLDGTCLASVGKDYQIRLYDSNLNNSSTFNKITQTYGSHASNNNNSNSFYANMSHHSLSAILSPNSSSSSTQSTPSPTQQQGSSHSNRLQAVKFSNSSNDLFFTGGWDRCVKIWDKRSASGHVNTISGPFICGSDAIDVDVIELILL